MSVYRVSSPDVSLEVGGDVHLARADIGAGAGLVHHPGHRDHHWTVRGEVGGARDHGHIAVTRVVLHCLVVWLAGPAAELVLDVVDVLVHVTGYPDPGLVLSAS